MNLQTMVKKGIEFGVKHSPKIFTGAAVFGVASTAILAAKGGTKAERLLNGEECSTKEKLKRTWHCYIPAAISGLLTSGFIIAGHSISAARYAQLITAYGLSETARFIYSNRIREEIGAERERVIMAQSNSEAIQKKLIPLDDNSDVDLSECDKIVRMKEYLSESEFHDSINNVKDRINAYNETELKRYGRSSLSVLYSYYNNPMIKPAPWADDLGWSYENGQVVEPMFTPCLEDNGKFYIILDYVVPPKYDF